MEQLVDLRSWRLLTGQVVYLGGPQPRGFLTELVHAFLKGQVVDLFHRQGFLNGREFDHPGIQG